MRVTGWTARAIASCTLALMVSAGGETARGSDPAPRVLCEVERGLVGLSVTADGKLLAARTFECVTRFFDASTGAKVRDVKCGGRVSIVSSLSAGPPPSIVTAELDGWPAIWDAVSGARRGTLQAPVAVSAQPGAPGDIIMTGPPGVPSAAGLVFAVWHGVDASWLTSHDSRTGKVAGRLPLSGARSDALGQKLRPRFTRVATSFDGRTVAALADGPFGGRAMRVFSVSPDGLRLESRGLFTGEEMSWSDGGIDSPVITDDGGRLIGTLRPGLLPAVSGVEEATVACWSTTSGKRLWTRRTAPRGMLPNVTAGSTVALPLRDAIELVDPDAGTTLTRLQAPEALLPDGLALAPGGGRLYAATASGKILVWDVASPSRPGDSGTATAAVCRQAGVVTSLAVAPDESLVVTGSPDGDVRVFDVDSHRELRALKGHQESVTSIAFVGGDPAWLITCSVRRIRVWNPATGSLRKELVAPDKNTRDGFSAHAAASPAGLVVAFRAQDKREVTIWEGEGKNRTLSRTQISCPSRLCLSQDGKRLGAMQFSLLPGDVSNGYGVIDTRTGESLWSRGGTRADALESERKDVYDKKWIATRFTPNGERFIRAANSRVGGHVRSNATETGAPQWSLDLPGVTLRDLVFRSDGRALLVTDSGLQILDTREGKVAPASGLPRSVTCAAFGPKSGALYLGMSDGSVVRTSLAK